MSTDYSAMESVVRNLGGIPIKPKALYKELETGCLRAVPDNELAAQKLIEFFNKPSGIRKRIGFETRQSFLKHYQWDKSGKAWEDYFDSVDILPEDLTWKSPPRIFTPEPKPEQLPPNVSHKDLARWLITKVLCEPDKVNSFMEARLIRDLMYKATTSTTGGMYFNESSAAFDGKQGRMPFDLNTAYQHMSNLCQRRNFWEHKRAEAFKLI
jgi:hypothetical protein